MSSLPTLYEYYTSDPITKGLSAEGPHFTLNNKNITIFSGAMHYFRVPPEYWRDRLRKMRAAGLNAVETYVPWNLHEPEIDLYDFGNSGTDFQNFLNIDKFLRVAQDEDLFVIMRPGPYICAEWDFGGLPAWFLSSKYIGVRTSNEFFMSRVGKYFGELMQILTPFQFTNGGPIIAFQIENEYGNTKVENEEIDRTYLERLKGMFESNGIVELLFTSDTPSHGRDGSIPGVLYTANFQQDPEKELTLLEGYQPGKPLMVMEYWTGWFDHWTEKHHTRSNAAFSDVLERILNFPASVNMYMFHGGTNWGFLNGANILDDSTDNSAIIHDTTSYDYDAPLSEAGDYTDKYDSVQALIVKYNKIPTKLPEKPTLIERIAYDKIEIIKQLTLSQLIPQLEGFTSPVVCQMESLRQNYGYIVYRAQHLNIAANSVLKIVGHVCDTVMVLINGELKSKILQNQDDLNGFGYWRLKDSTLDLGKAYDDATLDLIVENLGRSNFGKLKQFNQHKGLWQGDVMIDGEKLVNWTMYPLEFKKRQTESFSAWTDVSFSNGPALYKAILNIDEARDTYIDMRSWKRGIVIVNGFVLGRYCRFGPQQALYLPAPFLKIGENEIIIFEHFKPDNFISFLKDQIWETVSTF